MNYYQMAETIDEDPDLRARRAIARFSCFCGKSTPYIPMFANDVVFVYREMGDDNEKASILVNTRELD